MIVIRGNEDLLEVLLLILVLLLDSLIRGLLILREVLLCLIEPVLVL